MSTMMIEKEKMYTVNIFALTDRNGEALHIASDINIAAHSQAAFSRFLNMELARAEKGTYLPDYRIRHYAFGDAVSLREIKDRCNEPGALQSFVQRYGGIQLHDYSLRAAMFLRMQSQHLFKWVSSSTLDELSDPANTTLLKTDVDAYMGRLATFDANVGDKGRYAVVLETARGAMVFDDSGYGQLFYQRYMQHLADRFFDPANRDLKKVRESVITGPSAALMAQANSCRGMFSRYDLRLMPEKIVYQPSLIKSEHKEGTSTFHALGTDMDDLNRLVESYHLKMSEQNLYIKSLLRVRDEGFAPNLVSGSIRAQQLFSDEVKQFHRQAHNDNEGPSPQSRKADRELRERFGIGVGKEIITRHKDRMKSDPERKTNQRKLK